MSFDVFDGEEVEIALIGKRSEEMATILGQVETRRLLRASLERFRLLVIKD